MFFIMGISEGRDQVPYDKLTICDECGSYGRDEVFMTYRQLSLFFIPVFKWDKSYILIRSCCGSSYHIDKDLGQDLQAGRVSHIEKEDLEPIYTNKTFRCQVCGSSLDRSFEYCPFCGEKL